MYDRYNYSWEFYPPPYDFLSPVQPPGLAPCAPGVRSAGLSGCGCGCGGGCGRHGMGLFDSLDFSTWGWQEWGCVALGVYLVSSVVTDTKRATQKVRKAVRRRVYQRSV